ncbi:MAG: hypothetical protein ACRDZX_01050, partial [Acidimicrobiales bacterium]
AQGGQAQGGQAQGEQAQRGAPEDGIAWEALARLDSWRGGYDAVVGWADGPDEEALGILDQLAGHWPGRAVALVRLAEQDGAEAIISQLEGSGLKVLRFQPAGAWDEGAHLVAGAVPLPPG